MGENDANQPIASRYILRLASPACQFGRFDGQEFRSANALLSGILNTVRAEPDETTSHSTKLASGQVAGYQGERIAVGRVGLQSKEHWKKVYATKSADAVSWFQPHAGLSLDLIRNTGAANSAPPTCTETVFRSVRPGGHVIVAAFAEDGPLQCSGLPVMRYRADELHGEFGEAFTLLKHQKEAHHTPFGAVQQFVCCYCSRVSS